VRQVSERFPREVLAGDGVPREALLWDGSCGFCSDMVQRMERFARQPFKALPFQTVANSIPGDVMKFTDKQMHWVHKDGRIVGGSTALIEVLAHSGHPLLAAMLDSALLRPFTWLGYRLAARHRDRAGGACSIENRPKLAGATTGIDGSNGAHAPNGSKGRILTRFEG
jgi:predicted DCC family thiol-disulfide oxidoreductase YuxK